MIFYYANISINDNINLFFLFSLCFIEQMPANRGFSEGLRGFFKECGDEYNCIPTFKESLSDTNNDSRKKNKYYRKIIRLIPDAEFFNDEEIKKFRYIYTEVRRKFQQKIDRERRKGTDSWSQIRKTPNKDKVHKDIAESLTGEEVDLDKKGTIVFDLGRVVPEFAGLKQTIKIKQPSTFGKKKDLVEKLQLKQHLVQNEQMDTEFEYQKFKRDKIKSDAKSIIINDKAEKLYNQLLDTVEIFMGNMDHFPIKSEASTIATKNEADALLKVSQILKKK